MNFIVFTFVLLQLSGLVHASEDCAAGSNSCQQLAQTDMSGLLQSQTLMTSQSKDTDVDGNHAGSSTIIESAGMESTSDWQGDVLSLHNQYRSLHGAPPLSWSSSLARKASSCLHKNHYRNGHWDMNHCSSGENIAGMIGSFREKHGVKMWYDEIKSTPGGRGKVHSFSMGTGHYTQVVWKSSKKLGCARSNHFLICNYDPPGNYAGQFGSNVLPLGSGGGNLKKCGANKKKYCYGYKNDGSWCWLTHDGKSNWVKDGDGGYRCSSYNGYPSSKYCKGARR